MDLDLVKSEILQEVFRAGMPAPLPASERNLPPGHSPTTWPEKILAEAKSAESATTVKSSLPKVFNPLLRKQNLVNRSLIASARAGADGLAEALSAADRLESGLDILHRAASAAGISPNLSESDGPSLRRSAKTSAHIVEFPWVIRQTTRLPTGATVLVCGCAGSLLNLELASLGFQVLGIDLQACADAHPNFSFLEADPAAPPLPDASVDAVIAISCLGNTGSGHLAEGHPTTADLAAMQHWRRVTKPGGALIITLPFGQPSPMSSRQIFNAAGLKALFSDLKMEIGEYAQCSDQSAWSCPVSEAQASAATVNAAGRPQGLALIFARV